jgi:transposase InsO family protein
MSLITDELVRAVRTATPCRRRASARWAENVLLSYCLCHVAAWAVLRVFVCVDRPGRSGRPVRIPGIVTDALNAAQLYTKHVFPYYGALKKIISNRDPRFTAQLARELCRLLDIKQNISTAYHPQTDGQSERSNQWLEQYVQIYTNYQQTDWAAWLPLAQYVHNSWTSSMTKKTPFDLLMGYMPRLHVSTSPSHLPEATS